MRNCFSRYSVVGMYCDPAGWAEHVSAWEAEFAPKLKVKATSSHPLMASPRGKSAAVCQSLSEFRQALVKRDITYDGGPYLRAHLLNAMHRETRTGYLLHKASPESADRMDPTPGKWTRRGSGPPELSLRRARTLPPSTPVNGPR